MLTQLRLSITDKLKAAGIGSTEYVSETITPPIAVPVPGEPYIVPATGEAAKFGRIEIRFDVLVVSHRGTNKKSAAGIDSMIWDVIAALTDEWDVDRVSQPGEITLSGVKFMGAVVSVSQHVKEP